MMPSLVITRRSRASTASTRVVPIRSPGCTISTWSPACSQAYPRPIVLIVYGTPLRERITASLRGVVRDAACWAGRAAARLRAAAGLVSSAFVNLATSTANCCTEICVAPTCVVRSASAAALLARGAACAIAGGAAVVAVAGFVAATVAVAVDGCGALGADAGVAAAGGSVISGRDDAVTDCGYSFPLGARSAADDIAACGCSTPLGAEELVWPDGSDVNTMPPTRMTPTPTRMCHCLMPPSRLRTAGFGPAFIDGGASAGAAAVAVWLGGAASKLKTSTGSFCSGIKAPG